MQGGALSLAARLRIGHATGCASRVRFARSARPSCLWWQPRVSRAPPSCTSTRTSSPIRLPPGVERDLGYGFKNSDPRPRLPKRCSSTATTTGGSSSPRPASCWPACPTRCRPGWWTRLEAKSAVLPVGCDLRRLDGHRREGPAGGGRRAGGAIPARGRCSSGTSAGSTTRRPDELVRRPARRSRSGGCPSGWPWPGRTRARRPRASSGARTELADHIVQWGRVASEPTTPRFCGRPMWWFPPPSTSSSASRWWRPSTADAGRCLPRRLSYPELIPAEAHEDVLYGEGELVPRWRGRWRSRGPGRRTGSGPGWRASTGRAWAGPLRRGDPALLGGRGVRHGADRSTGAVALRRRDPVERLSLDIERVPWRRVAGDRGLTPAIMDDLRPRLEQARRAVLAGRRARDAGLDRAARASPGRSAGVRRRERRARTTPCWSSASAGRRWAPPPWPPRSCPSTTTS